MELRLLKKEGLWSMFETRFSILLMFRHLRCSTGLYCTCFSPVQKKRSIDVCFPSNESEINEMKSVQRFTRQSTFGKKAGQWAECVDG